MIRTRKELEFFIMADRMMNRGVFHYSLSAIIKRFIYPDRIMSYLEYMRRAEYYHTQKGVLAKIRFLYNSYWYHKRGVQLGFSIALDTLGYGVCIPHYGTIVVGQGSHIGKYAVLHTCTCIVSGGSVIGDAFNFCTGSIISKIVTLGNNVSVCANSVVNKNFDSNNVLIGGGYCWHNKGVPRMVCC